MAVVLPTPNAPVTIVTGTGPNEACSVMPQPTLCATPCAPPTDDRLTKQAGLSAPSEPASLFHHAWPQTPTSADTTIRVDIKAKLMWIQPVGGKQGIVDINATATRTVSESSTPNVRDVAIRETMLEAINLLDAEARRKVDTIAGILRP